VTTTVDTKVSDYEKGRGGAGQFDESVPAYGTGAYWPGGKPHLAIVNDAEETALPHRYLPNLANLIAGLLAPRMVAPLPTPTLPASLAASTSMGAMVNQFSGPITMMFPNVTNAQEFAQELPAALESQAPINVRGALQRGAARGRIQSGNGRR
jgi:hypothetical protein